jgi:hypothetical protein
MSALYSVQDYQKAWQVWQERKKRTRAVLRPAYAE